MLFDVKNFKKNFGFFAMAIGVIVILLVLSFIFKSNDTISLEEIDLTSGEIEYDKLVINEIMTSNSGTYVDSDGKLFDYVEIYNGTDQDIKLQNYGLSDEGNKVKWVFPDVTILAKDYVVVFLSGESKSGLYASFKLASAGGETITLSKPNGKVIDAVTTLAIAKNTVMARNVSGKWEVQTDPTPGFPNTIEGQKDFIDSLLNVTAEELVINEILPKNKGNFKDNLGNYSGYIEILNNSKKTINLTGYSLSNSGSINYKWQFPNINLGKGEVVLVYTSNRDIKDGVLHANFKLSNETGIVVLTNSKGEVISKVEYENLANGKAYIREENGYEASSIISPGYSNSIKGIEKFNSTIKTNNTLIINEAMNSNYKYMPNNGGNYYDWVELKNNSKEVINLGEYYLTTNTDNMTAYRLPDVNLAAGEYYVILASGDSNLSNNSYKHADFKLGECEGLYLTKSNKVVDAIFIADVPTGYSIGKGNSSGIYYYSSPTPKEKNGSGLRGIAYVPSIETKSGVYNNVKNVSVTIKGQGTIYYTLDGSKPTKSSKVYKGPLLLTKTTVVKAISVQEDKKNSAIATSTYIINENHSIPVMSLSLNSGNFRWINSNVWVTGREVEGYAEYFEEGKEGFEIGCGLQLFGGSTRAYPKKSYEIVFKKKYGAGELHYQVFDNRDYSTYQSLVLRNGSQDEYVPPRKSMIRDLLLTDLVDNYTNVAVRTYKPIILYINGNYWGIYFLREKIDDNYVSNNFNVPKEGTDIVRVDGEVKSGTKTKYNKMINYLKTHSLKNQKNYEEFKTMVNIESMADYWIAQTWPTNYDIVKNCSYYSNPNYDNGKWHLVYYDLDNSMHYYTVDYFRSSTSSVGLQDGHFSSDTNIVLRSLMQNKEFRTYYLERLSYHMNHTFNEKIVNAKIDEIVEILDPEMKRNLNRWDTFTYSSWKNDIAFLKTFTNKRRSYLVRQAKAYFGLTDTQVKKYFSK